MPDKIYLKQAGEPCVPVTVRINWLPSGTIKPLIYWTPDSSCYEIKHIYEATPLAFLKDRGVGIRFKVRVILKQAPEPYFDTCHFTPHEIYLYLADSMFCGKNIIDGRYGHGGKEFIPVTLDVFPNCEYEIIFFEARGTRYTVDKTVAVEPRASYHAGGAGIWHKVEARQVDEDGNDSDPNKSAARMSALYFEINKWFVHVKSA